MSAPDRLGPIAQISRSALTANARIVADGGGRTFPDDILRADAWGHGASLVRSILLAEGFAPADRTGALDPLTLFGLPGGARAANPAMRMTGTVLSTKDLRAGEGVSYGYAYRAEADTRVALATGGYAQGVVRALGGGVSVRLAGGMHPIVGRVAMDVCVIEIGDAPVARGDELVFFGDPARDEPSLAEWERATRLSAAELATAVGLRSSRQEAP